MAKLWNVGRGVGDEIRVPTVKRRDLDGKVKEFVKVPRNEYTGDRDEFVEHKPGNVYLAMNGYPFFVIPKDASFDVPPGASVKAIQDMCPHLVTQEEFESLQNETAQPEEAKADSKPDKGKKQN